MCQWEIASLPIIPVFDIRLKIGPSRGLIWHTDSGSQYATCSHRDIISQHIIRHSVSKKYFST